uniref:3-hydroxyisobutyryl-CoA hydrolase-like protein 5 n=1 Tax=Rhizophora mucronata TaxID=61149 RepID=A0A2P2KWA2_RHIMU
MMAGQQVSALSQI